MDTVPFYIYIYREARSSTNISLTLIHLYPYTANITIGDLISSSLVPVPFYYSCPLYHKYLTVIPKHPVHLNLTHIPHHSVFFKLKQSEFYFT